MPIASGEKTCSQRQHDSASRFSDRDTKGLPQKRRTRLTHVRPHSTKDDTVLLRKQTQLHGSGEPSQLSREHFPGAEGKGTTIPLEGLQTLCSAGAALQTAQSDGAVRTGKALLPLVPESALNQSCSRVTQTVLQEAREQGTPRPGAARTLLAAASPRGQILASREPERDTRKGDG